MKFRHVLMIAVAAMFVASCNFTLAADVTPPPGYVAPTAAPTLGPLYPASAPDVENGAAIYVEKCAACHGETGLGDGDQGKQLPVSVAAIGVSEVAAKAVPAKWYAIVTQGNLERFMPPFASLNDQERWDVISYALTLHATQEQIAQGQELFESNCKDCEKNFTDLKRMSELSENDIIFLIQNGDENIPAFGKDLSDDELIAVAVYIRTLTFARPAAPEPDPVTETPAAADSATPSTAGTATENTTQANVTPEAVASEGYGNVSGSVKNMTGESLPADLKIEIAAYDHGADPSAGPQQVLVEETPLAADGTYALENIELTENRIFVAKLTHDDITYQSEFVVVEAGAVELVIPEISVFASTDDFSALKIGSIEMFFDFASEDSVQIFAVYTFSNASEETIRINMGEGQNVPFIAFPDGAEGMGYEAMENSAEFVPTDEGFAMPPSDVPYGLIAFATIPKVESLAISQPAVLDIAEFTIFLPEGVEAEGSGMQDNGIQDLQGSKFHVYAAAESIKAGNTFDFTLTGKPSASVAVNPDVTQNSNLLIGIGALGVALILAGVFLYLRDKNQPAEKSGDEDEDDEDSFDDSESVLDAIIALDDQQRAGKIKDEAYQQRRAELKEKLKK